MYAFVHNLEEGSVLGVFSSSLYSCHCGPPTQTEIKKKKRVHPCFIPLFLKVGHFKITSHFSLYLFVGLYTQS